jgi:hypothetical protein
MIKLLQGQQCLVIQSLYLNHAAQHAQAECNHVFVSNQAYCPAIDGHNGQDRRVI